MRIENDRQPPLWVSWWMTFSAVIVTWDAAYCFLRPRSLVGGDLAWIWGPYNAFPYGMVDYLYGHHALESGDGFTNAQALLNVIEVMLALEYIYLRHTSSHSSSIVPKPTHRYHAHAPLVGFAGALMTLSKTALYFLQEYFCKWCMVGHNDRWTFWTIWVIPNGIWVIVPFVVCIVLGRFISNALMRDTAAQIAYLEWTTANASTAGTLSPKTKTDSSVSGNPQEDIEEDDIVHSSNRAPAAGLPLTFHPRNLPVLIIGSNRLAASRAATFLDVEAIVTVVSHLPVDKISEEIRLLIDSNTIKYTQIEVQGSTSWIKVLEQHKPALVCVTDTLIGSSRRSTPSARAIHDACVQSYIPVNISDFPAYSTYSFPSVHRFVGNNGEPSNLQVAVSTNGQGCRLAGRVKRDIVSRLPTNVGAAVDNVGKLRSRAKARAKITRDTEEDDTLVVDAPLNSPVAQLGTPSISRQPSTDRFELILNEQEQQLRRMRWVHQMSEYYSYEHLARLKDEEMESALETWSNTGGILPHHEGFLQGKSKSNGKGRILLIGSGPGHPGLLTMAAHHALKTSTLILSDKLVPAEILALIPSTTKLHIAKKFPGNAEGAQNEMMELALEGARAGEIVVRLKQGDPFVYGRGGEEVLYFREHGYESVVIPGISSALAGPLMMGIPVTQRGVAESLVMCTGVGRAGKAVQLPGYVKSRTLLMLMGVARIGQIIDVLTTSEPEVGARDGASYPKHLPIAIVERASSPDQRVILSTLGEIEDTLKKLDERPPGMMVVGWAALCLEGEGRVDILDSTKGEEQEKQIVRDWLGEEGWKSRQGLSEEWRELFGDLGA